MPFPRVTVDRKGRARALAGHPWIYRSDLESSGGSAPGDLVRVSDTDGQHCGFALFSNRSEIALRMLTRDAQLATDFLDAKVEAAVAWRKTIVSGSTAYRILHGEGDGLPSMIVDRYGEYLVVQTLSQGAERLKTRLVRVLVERLHPRGVLERNDSRVRLLEGLERRIGVLHGEIPELVEVEEEGVRFEVNLRRGQKTGLFLDQRENHSACRAYARGRVLDGFTYNGGFGLHAARVSDEVLAYDVSDDAVLQTRRNAQLNGISNLDARAANVFDLLRDLGQRGERFDTVILDPPAFAKNRRAIEKAWRGYNDINRRAFKLLTQGGFLITCSCSYHVHESDFERILERSAHDAGVTVHIVEKRRQARDHPTVLGVPETHYLKCFILRRVS